MAIAKNIVIIANSCAIVGGAEKVAQQAAILCAKKGRNVVFFAASGPANPKLEEAGVKVVCLNQEYVAFRRNKIAAFIQGLWNRKAKAALIEVLNGLDPSDSIVNLHSWTHALSASVLAAIKESGIPLTIVAHDYFLACPNGGFYNYVEGKPCQLRYVGKECRRCNCDKRSMIQKKYRVARFNVQTSVLKDMHPLIIFLSSFSRKILEQSIPFNYSAYFLQNPINISKPKNYASYEERAIDALFVGRVDIEKNCEWFCRAAVDNGLNSVVVGDGVLKKELQAKYPSVSFLGWLSEEQVVKHYHNSKALVFPSCGYEVAPLVLREAQICGGLPCLVRAGTAGVSYIEDYVTGICTDYDDYDAFREGLKLIVEKTTNECLRRNIVNVDYSNHSPEFYVKELLVIFDQAVQEKVAG